MPSLHEKAAVCYEPGSAGDSEDSNVGRRVFFEGDISPSKAIESLQSSFEKEGWSPVQVPKARLQEAGASGGLLWMATSKSSKAVKLRVFCTSDQGTSFCTIGWKK